MGCHPEDPDEADHEHSRGIEGEGEEAQRDEQQVEHVPPGTRAAARFAPKRSCARGRAVGGAPPTSTYSQWVVTPTRVTRAKSFC